MKSFHVQTLLVLLAGALVAPGCGTAGVSRSPKAPRRTVLHLEPIKLLATRSGIEVLDAKGLFEAGGQHLEAKRYKRSLQHYDRLLRHFPRSRLCSPALYNAGLANEGLRRFDRAAARYRELLRRFGGSRNALDAAFRLGGAYAELRQWAKSASVFGKLLKRKDLTSGDRIECYARKGLAHFRLHDHGKTRATLMAAVRFYSAISGAERLDNDFFVGMVHYYLAAIPHVRFRTTTVAAGSKMGAQLDEKARLLLASQAGYIRAIRIKNPYWATAAGFQIGSLYREFYNVLMTTLPDFKKLARKNARKAKIGVKLAERQLMKVYLQEVHKKVKPLLSKAIRVFERNVLMAQRVGIKTRWVGKSRRQISELKRLMMAKPADAIRMLPKRPPLPEDQPSLRRKPPSLPTPKIPSTDRVIL